MSSGPRGSRAHDRSVLPPEDVELTARSLRWTVGATAAVVSVWVGAGLLGAFFDATSRYQHLTWALVLVGRGGAYWDLQVSRGDLAVFALVVAGIAVVPALVGVRRTVSSARGDRPHHGPSRWTLVGVTLAAGPSLGLVVCFVLSELLSPASGLLLFGAAVPLVGVMVVGAWMSFVRHRFDPWRAADRAARAERRARRAEAAAPARAPWPDVLRLVLREGLRTSPPVPARSRDRTARAARAARTTLRRTHVGPSGVTWRSRWWRPGHLPASRAGEVLTVVLWGTRYRTICDRFLLVVDVDDQVVVRVRLPRQWGSVDVKRRSVSAWEALGVPVSAIEGDLRAKDLRRRWPEAFSWPHAYPILTLVLTVVVWMVAVVPVLDHLYGA